MPRVSKGNQLIIISWRDIPAQVTARNGRTKTSVQLSGRFQRAIDSAATRAGKRTTDDYLGEWRRTESPCGPNLATEADAAAAELELRFTGEVLRAYIANGGYEPNDSANQANHEGGDR